MSHTLAISPRSLREAETQILIFPLRIFHWWINLPILVFMVTLTAMLFRPPDLKAFPIDRVAFLFLIILVCARLLLRCESLRIYAATWPLLGLLVLGLWGVLSQPYEARAWSVFAAKYCVPIVCFHVAGLVFRAENSRRALEIFLLLVLVYLSVISVLSLFGANWLIFPSFITDEGIGIHADRARGPFLQAVANGVCLTLLGLIALDCFRRKKLNGALGLLLIFAVPAAIVATKTRAVWASAAVSVLLLLWFGSAPRIRRVSLALCMGGAIVAGALFISRDEVDSLAERLLDRSPVDFRTEMYGAGWQMFGEKPFFGWSNEWNVQPEIQKRVSSFHPEYYVFHNTFLELAVEHGLLGVGFYVWLMICLIRLRRPSSDFPEIDAPFSGPHFCALWPVLLIVYLLNASAVVMNYQFVNALLFTIAGILAANAHTPNVSKNLESCRAAA